MLSVICNMYQKETFQSILRYEKKTCDYKSHISIIYFLQPICYGSGIDGPHDNRELRLTFAFYYLFLFAKPIIFFYDIERLMNFLINFFFALLTYFIFFFSRKKKPNQNNCKNDIKFISSFVYLFSMQKTLSNSLVLFFFSSSLHLFASPNHSSK
jgi:hypothetical protein